MSQVVTGVDRPDVSGAHAMAADAVAARLAVEPTHGLTPHEVEQREALFGSNEVEPAARPTLWSIVWHAMREPFVVLLFVAGVLAVLLGEVRDGALVLVGLLPDRRGGRRSPTYRSERALETLRAAAAPTARLRPARRRRRRRPAARLVPGDVVLLREARSYRPTSG